MTRRAVDRGRFGWAVEFDSGFISAMPDEKTARECAAAPELLAALEEMAIELSLASFGLNEKEVGILKRAEAAIAKAKGGKE